LLPSRYHTGGVPVKVKQGGAGQHQQREERAWSGLGVFAQRAKIKEIASSSTSRKQRYFCWSAAAFERV
jgi:hypothetical protein